MAKLPDVAVGRIVAAVHGRQELPCDPAFEIELAQGMASHCSRSEILAMFRRFSQGEDYIDFLLRRNCVRALAKRCGSGLHIAPGAVLRHPETFEIGDGVVIGERAIIQGRFDGTCMIGDKVWIGAQSFLDARDLVLGNNVGWGPGARLLGSKHTGQPLDVPIIATDLLIAPVRVEDDVDVGVNAVLLPGITIGRGAMIGAGAVVTKDVPAYAKVAGVPAQIIGYRHEGHRLEGASP